MCIHTHTHTHTHEILYIYTQSIFEIFLNTYSTFEFFFLPFSASAACRNWSTTAVGGHDPVCVCVCVCMHTHIHTIIEVHIVVVEASTCVCVCVCVCVYTSTHIYHHGSTYRSGGSQHARTRPCHSIFCLAAPQPLHCVDAKDQNSPSTPMCVQFFFEPVYFFVSR